VSMAANVAYIPRRSRPGAWPANGPTAAGQCSALLGAARAQADKGRIRDLEGELRGKEKALAETAALLVLRKKAQAILKGKARPYAQRPRSPPSDRADRRGLKARGAAETGVRGVGH